jgi:hypothetical protein
LTAQRATHPLLAKYLSTWVCNKLQLPTERFVPTPTSTPPTHRSRHWLCGLPSACWAEAAHVLCWVYCTGTMGVVFTRPGGRFTYAGRRGGILLTRSLFRYGDGGIGLKSVVNRQGNGRGRSWIRGKKNRTGCGCVPLMLVTVTVYVKTSRG